MATNTSQKEQRQEIGQLVQFFDQVGKRLEYAESLEQTIAAQEQQLESQRQEVEGLRGEREALTTVIEALKAELKDLTSQVPTKRYDLERTLQEMHQAVAEAGQELIRLQGRQVGLKQQISDVESTLRNLKSDIMGLSDHARARTFAPAMPSLSGPAIINSPVVDYNPLEEPNEEASA
jgi:chromosome segregation ATPase